MAQPPLATRPRNNARTGARARGQLDVEIVDVRLSAGNRVNGLALVDVRIGPVVATYGYQRMRRKGRWRVHLPVDCDGNDALRLPGEVDEQVVQLVHDAVEGDETVAAAIKRRWSW